MHRTYKIGVQYKLYLFPVKKNKTTLQQRSKSNMFKVYVGNKNSHLNCIFKLTFKIGVNISNIAFVPYQIYL